MFCVFSLCAWAAICNFSAFVLLPVGRPVFFASPASAFFLNFAISSFLSSKYLLSFSSLLTYKCSECARISWRNCLPFRASPDSLKREALTAVLYRPCERKSPAPPAPAKPACPTVFAKPFNPVINAPPVFFAAPGAAPAALLPNLDAPSPSVLPTLLPNLPKPRAPARPPAAKTPRTSRYTCPPASFAKPPAEEATLPKPLATSLPALQALLPALPTRLAASPTPLSLPPARFQQH